jgi:hypothetical protein
MLFSRGIQEFSTFVIQFSIVVLSFSFIGRPGASSTSRGATLVVQQMGGQAMVAIKKLPYGVRPIDS